MSGACLVTLNPSTPPRHAAIAAAHLNGQHLVQPGWRGEAETGAPVSVVIVPGWRNSGPGHWQSLWAARIAGAVRVEQEDWLQPHRSPWVASVEEAIAAAPHPVILVAHSLGCIASVHAVEQLRSKPAGSIAGALFVAPADPERRV